MKILAKNSITYSLIGAIVVPCFGRIALSRTGHSDDYFRYEEKERLVEQLRQSHKMEAVGTMAGGIAHDFNNILAIIFGNAEMAIDDIPPENSARHNIEQVLHAAIRAKNLVRQILAFSRKEKKELISIRPQSLINETLKLLRSTMPATISIIQEISHGGKSEYPFCPGRTCC